MVVKAAPSKASTRSGQRLVVAIPISISGEDTSGRAFTESTATVVVNRVGAKLITTHELALDSTIQVTVPSRNRVSSAQVVWLGEKTGIEQEIAIEVKNPDGFWGIQFPDDPVDWTAIAARRLAAQQATAAEQQAPPPSPAAPVTSPAPPAPATTRPAAASAPPAPAPRPATPAPQVVPPLVSPAASKREPAAVAGPAPAPPARTPAAQPTAPGVNLTGILDEMVASAVEQDLTVAISGLRRDLSQQVGEMQSAAVSIVQEQAQRAIAAQIEQFEMQAIDVVTRNQQALEQSVQEFVNTTRKDIEKKLELLYQDAAQSTRGDVLEAVFSTKDRLQKETGFLLTTATESLRHGLQQETVALEKQFAEQCQTRADRIISARLDEASHTLSECARHADEDFSERVARRSEQTAGRFELDLQRKFKNALDEFAERLEQDLDQTVNHVRQVFMKKVVHELEQHRQGLLQEAQDAREQLLHQVQSAQRQLPAAAPQPDQETLRRTHQALARLVQDLGEALGNAPPPAPNAKKKS